MKHGSKSKVKIIHRITKGIECTMKKVVVVYGSLEDRVKFVNIVRSMNLPGGVNNVKTNFDNGERFDIVEEGLDELSYFAGILNLAMQRNPELIILHEIKNRETLNRLTDLFDLELYNILIGRNDSQSYYKHDFIIERGDEFSKNTKELIEKLI